MFDPTRGPAGLACPLCKGPLDAHRETLDCAACARSYPVVAGIPDLRVAADPWLGMAEDRDKALRLAALTVGMSFEQALRTYWEITPSTPRALAERYIGHVLAAEDRSAEWLERVVGPREGGGGGPWLDIGCGTGDLLAPLLSRGRVAIGADVALRWLVIARRRPGLERAMLVCCNAEALPLANGVCGAVSALGLLEHCRDEHIVFAEAARVLQSGAEISMRSTNRYSLLPEPHVGVWGVGFVARRRADAFVRRRSGQRYLHHRPLSVRELRRALRQAGFQNRRVGAAPLLPADRARLPGAAAPLFRLYDVVRRLPLFGRVLAWVAPLLELRATKP